MCVCAHIGSDGGGMARGGQLAVLCCPSEGKLDTCDEWRFYEVKTSEPVCLCFVFVRHINFALRYGQ